MLFGRLGSISAIGAIRAGCHRRRRSRIRRFLRAARHSVARSDVRSDVRSEGEALAQSHGLTALSRYDLQHHSKCCLADVSVAKQSPWVDVVMAHAKKM